MSTLTANIQRRPEHCVHKLPSSCRLTAMPICCACQDQRPHAGSYSKYVDGVGFVMLGTRQERYCWPCKVFWDRRVAASGMRQADTRIPDRPDQRRFLEAWYDWQKGFRIIHHEDGTDERQALVGGNLGECTPGSLPPEARDMYEEESPVIYNSEDSATAVNLQIDPEDRIFDPESPQAEQQNDNEPNQANLNPVEDSTLEDLRRDLANARQAEEQSQRDLSEVEQLKVHIQHQLSRAEELATGTMERQHADLESRRQRVRHLERTLRRRTRGDQAARVFGTREDVQHPDFVSPITTFFQRHYLRNQQQEEERRQGPHSQGPVTNSRMETRGQWHTSTPFRASTSEDPSTIEEASTSGTLGQIDTVQDIPSLSNDLRNTIDLALSAANSRNQRRSRRKRKPPILLSRKPRPEPLMDSQMHMNMKCNVCFEQLANVVLIPCGHCLMCEWCSDAHALFNPEPDRFGDDRGVRTCPACRQQVKNRIRLFGGETQINETKKALEVDGDANDVEKDADDDDTGIPAGVGAGLME